MGVYDKIFLAGLLTGNVTVGKMLACNFRFGNFGKHICLASHILDTLMEKR